MKNKQIDILIVVGMFLDANRDRRMTSDLDSYQRQEIAMPDVRALLCHIRGRPARTARKAV
jgi:hypothetical protein